MEQESGEKIAPEKVLVSEVDLDRDGTAEIFAYAIGAPFYCNNMGCLPRIYRKTGNAWSNVLNDPSGITRGNPGNVSLIGMANDGFSDILLGSVVIEWDGKAYREFQPSPVTQLDDAAFQTACASVSVCQALRGRIGRDGEGADRVFLQLPRRSVRECRHAAERSRHLPARNSPENSPTRRSARWSPSLPTISTSCTISSSAAGSS